MGEKQKMIIVPGYKKFKKSDIDMAIGQPFPIIAYPRCDLNDELIKKISDTTYNMGFLYPQITIDHLTVFDDVRKWNVVMVKKWHRLIIAIYDLLEVDYLEL